MSVKLFRQKELLSALPNCTKPDAENVTIFQKRIDFMNVVRGIIGIAFLIGVAYLFSNNRKKINWKLVLSGLSLQIVFAVLILKGDDLGHFFAPLRWPKQFFNGIGYIFVLILEFTTDGAKFIFGNLALSPGVENSMGFFFAFQVLPTIIFFASLMSVLYYLGIMQRIVQVMASAVAHSTSAVAPVCCQPVQVVCVA